MCVYHRKRCVIVLQLLYKAMENRIAKELFPFISFDGCGWDVAALSTLVLVE